MKTVIASEIRQSYFLKCMKTVIANAVKQSVRLMKICLNTIHRKSLKSFPRDLTDCFVPRNDKSIHSSKLNQSIGQSIFIPYFCENFINHYNLAGFMKLWVKSFMTDNCKLPTDN